MSSTFEDTRIIAFQPKQEKDSETKETLDKMVTSGVHFYRIRTNDNEMTKKMIFLQ